MVEYVHSPCFYRSSNRTICFQLAELGTTPVPVREYYTSSSAYKDKKNGTYAAYVQYLKEEEEKKAKDPNYKPETYYYLAQAFFEGTTAAKQIQSDLGGKKNNRSFFF
jgi:hypothetical protein